MSSNINSLSGATTVQNDPKDESYWDRFTAPGRTSDFIHAKAYEPGTLHKADMEERIDIETRRKVNKRAADMRIEYNILNPVSNPQKLSASEVESLRSDKFTIRNGIRARDNRIKALKDADEEGLERCKVRQEKYYKLSVEEKETHAAQCPDKGRKIIRADGSIGFEFLGNNADKSFKEAREQRYAEIAKLEKLNEIDREFIKKIDTEISNNDSRPATHLPGLNDLEKQTETKEIIADKVTQQQKEAARTFTAMEAAKQARMDAEKILEQSTSSLYERTRRWVSNSATPELAELKKKEEEAQQLAEKTKEDLEVFMALQRQFEREVVNEQEYTASAQEHASAQERVQELQRQHNSETTKVEQDVEAAKDTIKKFGAAAAAVAEAEENFLKAETNEEKKSTKDILDAALGRQAAITEDTANLSITGSPIQREVLTRTKQFIEKGVLSSILGTNEYGYLTKEAKDVVHALGLVEFMAENALSPETYAQTAIITGALLKMPGLLTSGGMATLMGGVSKACGVAGSVITGLLFTTPASALAAPPAGIAGTAVCLSATAGLLYGAREYKNDYYAKLEKTKKDNIVTYIVPTLLLAQKRGLKKKTDSELLDYLYKNPNIIGRPTSLKNLEDNEVTILKRDSKAFRLYNTSKNLGNQVTSLEDFISDVGGSAFDETKEFQVAVIQTLGVDILDFLAKRSELGLGVFKTPDESQSIVRLTLSETKSQSDIRSYINTSVTKLKQRLRNELTEFGDITLTNTEIESIESQMKFLLNQVIRLAQRASVLAVAFQKFKEDVIELQKEISELIMDSKTEKINTGLVKTPYFSWSNSTIFNAESDDAIELKKTIKDKLANSLLVTFFNIEANIVDRKPMSDHQLYSIANILLNPELENILSAAIAQQEAIYKEHKNLSRQDDLIGALINTIIEKKKSDLQAQQERAAAIANYERAKHDNEHTQKERKKITATADLKMNTSVVLLRTTLDNIDEWFRQNKKITPDMYEHLNNIFQEAVDNGMSQSADSTQLTNRTTDYLSKQIHDRIHNQDTAETKKSKAVENLRKKLDAYDIFKKLNMPITLQRLNELRQLHEAAVEGV